MTSCVDTIILPENKTLDEDFWKKKSEVESVVATAYSQLRDGDKGIGDPSFQRNIVVWSDFRSDEMVIASDFKTMNKVREYLTQIYSMQIQPNNTFTTWSPLYSCINYCNLVLEKGESVMNYDPDYTIGDWNANKAQVTALRAYCYFTLVRVFRDVPVTPHAYFNSSEDLTVEQSAPSVVLQQCIDDLKSVVNDAPTNNAYGDSRDRGYFNKDGINALLADIYLWRAAVNHDANDYQECINYCDKVIAAKKASHVIRPFDKDQTEKPYYLATYDNMYDDIFGQRGQNSEESIMELQYNENAFTNNVIMNLYYGYNGNKSGYGYFKATTAYGSTGLSKTDIFKASEDQRLWESTYNSTSEQYAIRKFVAPLGRTTNTKEEYQGSMTNWTKNWIIYRLTDIMLMKAEALVELGKNEGDDQKNRDAFDIVKFVNDRAMTTTTRFISYDTYKDKMEQLVMDERARELCFEGKRWFDLMRYNYRHINGVDYTKKLSELGGQFVANSDEFFEIALNKYTSTNAMKAKMPSEPYMYMPLNEEELQVNKKLIQNPVYKATSK